LSAIEEKALLKARYEAEENNALPNGNSSPPPSFGEIPIKNGANNFTAPTPPPLMPRPPVHYIQETQEEDARVRDSVGQEATLPTLDNQLDLRPFTPFTVGLGPSSPKIPGPPPPLPPKALDG